MYEAIVWNGKNSYLDFGLTIAEPPKMTNPKLNEVRESVPYMNGDYDFTYQNGKPTYSRRQIKVVFNVTEDCFDDMWRKRCEAVRWIMSAHGGALSFDRFMHGWQFEDVSPAVSEDFEIIGKRAGRLEVVFTAAPYLSNGKQNITIIPSCPAFKGNTFGYIHKSGGTLKACTSNDSSGGAEFTTRTVGTVIFEEHTITENTPSELVIAAYQTVATKGQLQIENIDGNITNVSPDAVAEQYGGKLSVYRYTSAKYPNAGVIRFTAEVTAFRTISAMTFDSVFPAQDVPIRCRRNDTDIQLSVNGKRSADEFKLSEGGNIITISGTAPAEVYLACRKEAL